MADGDGNLFHRLEVKYLVNSDAVPALRGALTQILDRDSHCAADGYPVWSVYYDTPCLRFYWDKIEGRPFRRKLRLRLYGDPRRTGADATVYVEVKQRAGRMTDKRRVPLPYATARMLCDQRVPLLDTTGMTKQEKALPAEVLRLVSRLDLRPVTAVGYQREAFVGGRTDPQLRVTLDRDIRARDHSAGDDTDERQILGESQTVLEIKTEHAVPTWLVNLATQHRLMPLRLSKYCQSVEELGHAPRSVFHVDAAQTAVPAR